MRAITKAAFGRQMKAMRRRRGQTLAQAGAEIGVDSQTVWRWENKGRVPTQSHVVRAALRYLFGPHAGAPVSARG